MTNRRTNKPHARQMLNNTLDLEKLSAKPQKDAPEFQLSKEDLLLYDQLRREILHRDTISLQTLGAITVFVGALMGFAFSNQVVSAPLLKVFLFITAEYVAVIGQMLYLDRRRGMNLLSSYIRVFIESKAIDLKWETRVADFREIAPKLGLKIRRGLQQLAYAGMQTVNAVLAGWYTLELRFPSTILVYSSHIQIPPVPEYMPLVIFSLIQTPFIWLFIAMPILHGKYGRPSTFDNIWYEVKRREDVAALRRLLRLPPSRL